MQDSEFKAQTELVRALNMEEDLWRENSRIKWHIHGDRNTNFFHTYAKIRRNTSLIFALVIDNDIVTDQKALENHIVSQYENLFNTRFIPQDNDLIRDNILVLVNDQTNSMLTMVPIDEEIHRAVSNLSADSAPGPDGFGGIFYHKY